MRNSIHLCAVLAMCLVGVLAAPSTARAQAMIKVGDHVSLRFGGQIQAWGDVAEDADGYYTKNILIRRLRLIMGGQVARQVSMYLQADVTNLGLVTAKGPGINILDAFLSYKPFAASESAALRDAFTLDAGLFLVPISRNGLQSTLTFLPLDAGTTTGVAAFNGLVLRDTGIQLRGHLFDARLEYRVACFQGLRDLANGRNSLRFAGFLQFNFFDREKGFAFHGYNYGKSRILALSAGVDVQGSYRTYSAALAASQPVFKGDEINALVQYFHYEGGTTVPTIPVQNDVLVELAYYISGISLAPFAKVESQYFVDGAINQNKGVTYVGGGLKYFVADSNFNIGLAYTRTLPRSDSTTDSVARPGLNRFTLQLQAFYY